jgi:UDP:flavonoid glycosyltransferase YjiC (YdhE family)
MARILFVGLDAGGNVPPAAAIAHALTERGHDVEFAGYGTGLVDGADSAPIAGLGTFDAARASSTAHVIAHYVRAAVGPGIERRVAELIAERHPDAVVVDCMMLSAIRGATRSGVPTSVLFHTLAEYWLHHWARGPVGLAAGVRALRPAKVWGRAAQRLVVTEHSLDPLRDRAAYRWTGSTESGVAPVPRADGEPPLVLVSLSSTWFPGQADAYRRIVAALSDLPVRAIVTTGGAELEEPLRPSPNIDVRGRVPHGEILPHASLVISHGGHSTALRALTHGVPLLVMPMHPLLDQPIVGRAVADAGLGRVLPKSAGTTAIRDTVAALLVDDAVAAATAAVGRRLRAARDGSADGAATAAALIASLAPTGSTPAPPRR